MRSGGETHSELGPSGDLQKKRVLKKRRLFSLAAAGQGCPGTTTVNMAITTWTNKVHTRNEQGGETNMRSTRDFFLSNVLTGMRLFCKKKHTHRMRHARNSATRNDEIFFGGSGTKKGDITHTKNNLKKRLVAVHVLMRTQTCPYAEIHLSSLAH